jgi:hypothetical protein
MIGTADASSHSEETMYALPFLLSLVFTWSLAFAQVSPSLAVHVSAPSFRLGDRLRTALELSNPGPSPVTVDMYVGIVTPNGPVYWLKDVNTFEGSWSNSLNEDPRTFLSLWPGMTLIPGLRQTWTEFVEYTFTGPEPAGTYHLLVAWTMPGRFADGRIDPGDVIAGDWKAFNFTP